MNNKSTIILGLVMMVASGMVLAQDININSATLHAQRGDALGVEQVGGALSRLMKYQKQLVFHIFKQLGKENISGSLRREINKPQTTSMDALLLFSQGLDHQDRGHYEEASKSFSKALEKDPGFTLAHLAHISMPTIKNEEEIRTVAVAAGKSNADRSEGKGASSLITKRDEQVADITTGDDSQDSVKSPYNSASNGSQMPGDDDTIPPTDISQNITFTDIISETERTQAAKLAAQEPTTTENPNFAVPLSTLNSNIVWLALPFTHKILLDD